MICLNENEIAIKPDTSMSYLILDQYPLFDYADEKNDIHILCLGGGRFMRQMALTIASCGQMIGYQLYIHIVANNTPECLEKLLKMAPELRYYSQIDEAIHVDPQYQYVHFSFGFEKDLKTIAAQKRIFNKYGNCKYVIVSLEDTDTSTAVAERYSALLSKQVGPIRPLIHYYSGSDAPTTVERGTVEMVPFNSDFAKYKDALNDKMRMAFRVHYMYQRIYNPTCTAPDEEKEFKGNSEYSQLSSFAAAIHIRYKLKSIGIDPKRSKKGKEAIAKQYQKKLPEYRDQLIALEHRRWVLFMISQGYTFPRVLNHADPFYLDTTIINRYFYNSMPDGVYNGRFRSDEKKLHPCLVPSSATDKTLPEDHQLWDSFQNYQEIDKTSFDTLDKISLKLHLFAKKRIADKKYQSRIKNLLKTDLAIILDSNLSSNVVLKNSFDVLCKEIADAISAKKATGIPNACDHFLENCTDLDIDTREAVRKLLKQINNEFSIYNEYNLYHDYKKPDAGIVDHLLWVYCCDDNDITLVKMYSKGSISNIASFLTIEPKEFIIYGVPKEKTSESQELYSSLLDNGCPVSFVTGHEKENEIVKDLSILAKKSSRVLIDDTGTSGALAVAARIASEKHKNIGIVRYDYETSSVLNYYQFPLASVYTLKRKLKAEQVFSLGGATIRHEELRERNYLPILEMKLSTLWNLFTKTGPWISAEAKGIESNYPHWNKICDFFQYFSGEPYAEFYLSLDNAQLSDIESKNWFACKRIIPTDRVQASKLETVLKAAAKNKEFPILRRLTIIPIDNDDSSVSFEVLPIGLWLKERFEYLLENIGGEPLEYKYFYNKNTCKHIVCISSGTKNAKKVYSYGSCVYIRNASYFCKTNSEEKTNIMEMRSFLEAMEASRLIKNLKFMQLPSANSIDLKSYRVSFKFASPIIPQLFVKKGNLLEAYSWSQMVKCGVFDDVKPNLSFSWGSGTANDEQLDDELDVVATRNMETVVVSCKMSDFQKDHISDVKSLAESFSEMAKPVVIYTPNNLRDSKDNKILSQNARRRVADNGVYLIDGRILAAGKLGVAIKKIALGELTPADFVTPPTELL